MYSSWFVLWLVDICDTCWETEFREASGWVLTVPHVLMAFRSPSTVERQESNLYLWKSGFPWLDSERLSFVPCSEPGWISGQGCNCCFGDAAGWDCTAASNPTKNTELLQKLLLLETLCGSNWSKFWSSFLWVQSRGDQVVINLLVIS